MNRKEKVVDGLMYNLVKEMSITEINRLLYTGAHVVDECLCRW